MCRLPTAAALHDECERAQPAPHRARRTPASARGRGPDRRRPNASAPGRRRGGPVRGGARPWPAPAALPRRAHAPPGASARGDLMQPRAAAAHWPRARTRPPRGSREHRSSPVPRSPPAPSETISGSVPPRLGGGARLAGRDAGARVVSRSQRRAGRRASGRQGRAKIDGGRRRERRRAQGATTTLPKRAASAPGRPASSRMGRR